MPTTNTSQPKRPFGSPGTSTHGSEVTGYTAGRYHTVLKTSDGRTILDSRCSVATSYPNVEDGPTFALVFALRGRFIVGYALGMEGMLFRGELRTDLADDSEARQAARDVSEHWIERDAEEDDRFDAQQSDDDPEEDCEECGEPIYRDCNGDARCEECDPPCPCCDDGGGPGADDESDDDGPSDPKAVPRIADLDPFTRGYLEMALFTSTEDDEPLEGLYTLDDIADGSLVEAAETCRQFQGSVSADLEGRDPSRAGGDFWLTRNRHGAGYWDGDYPDDIGSRLTDAAHAWGSSDAYVGDDGRVYLT
jgi:hypothetical protein